MSDAIKRLREKAASNGERGYVSIVLKIDECLVLLDIAEAVGEIANRDTSFRNLHDMEDAVHKACAAYHKLEAP